MRCSNCGTENRPQARFCHDCGQRLSVAKKPVKEDNNRGFWLAVLGLLVLVFLGICGLSGLFIWRQLIDEQETVDSVSATENGSRTTSGLVSLTPTLGLPTPVDTVQPAPKLSPVVVLGTTIPEQEQIPTPTINTPETISEVTNGRIVYIVRPPGPTEFLMDSLVSVLPDGTSEAQIMS